MKDENYHEVWEEEIREDQRKKCWNAVEAQKKCDATGWPIAMDVYAHKQAILNAGKSPEGEKEIND